MLLNISMFDDRLCTTTWNESISNNFIIIILAYSNKKFSHDQNFQYSFTFQLIGLLTFILACVAIPSVQEQKVNHMLIVIIVFLLFMAALGGLLHFASAQSSTDEYDVEKQTKGILS